MNNNSTQEARRNGNALSDQPESARRALLAEVEAKLAARGADANAAAARSMDRGSLFSPELLRLFGTLVEAVTQAVEARSRGETTSRGEFKRDYVLGPGAIEYFPTWSFWGRTFVRMRNTGSVPTVVMINDDRFHLNPGEETTKDGQWAAFPIRVVNTIESPGSQVTVMVW